MTNAPRLPRFTPGPRRKLSLAIAAQLLLASQAHAAPEGGNIVGGSGAIARDGVNTTVTQDTDKLAIDWQSFNVGADERVEFIQPGRESLALNRILGSNGSKILGSIEANGNVILVNPNGVFFGDNATIDVGGLVASGLAINPGDFMNGDFAFSAMEGADGAVVNAGLIKAATGGDVVLQGKSVDNQGLISAKLGSVTLAAGKESILTFDDSGLIGVRVTEEVLQSELGVDAAVKNSGDIDAEGGKILLTGSASQNVFTSAVNAGEMNAKTSVLMHDDGSFTLGGGSDVVNTGSLSVASDNTDAGQVIVAGENVTHTGQINAHASGTHKAGDVELHAQNTTLVAEQGSINVSADQTTGGSAKVLGNQVGLFNEATIDASGQTGGGTVHIGGGFQGKNEHLRNAQKTIVHPEANINADATQNGDGGEVIVWADDATAYAGNISVRGGQTGGDGGFVEVSGKEDLLFIGDVDREAVNGLAGVLLLDPSTIQIDNSELTEPSDDISLLFPDGFAGFDDPANITGTFITGLRELLQSGSVYLQATGGITFRETSVTADPTNTNTLVLESGGSVYWDDEASISLGQGDLVVIAGSAGCDSCTSGNPAIYAGQTTTSGDVLLYSSGDVELVNFASGAFNANSLEIRALGDVTVGDDGPITLPAGMSIYAGDTSILASGSTNQGNIFYSFPNEEFPDLYPAVVNGAGTSAGNITIDSATIDTSASNGSVILNASGSIGITDSDLIIGLGDFYATAGANLGCISGCSAITDLSLLQNTFDVQGNVILRAPNEIYEDSEFSEPENWFANAGNSLTISGPHNVSNNVYLYVNNREESIPDIFEVGGLLPELLITPQWSGLGPIGLRGDTPYGFDLGGDFEALINGFMEGGASINFTNSISTSLVRLELLEGATPSIGNRSVGSAPINVDIRPFNYNQGLVDESFNYTIRGIRSNGGDVNIRGGGLFWGIRTNGEIEGLGNLTIETGNKFNVTTMYGPTEVGGDFNVISYSDEEVAISIGNVPVGGSIQYEAQSGGVSAGLNVGESANITALKNISITSESIGGSLDLETEGIVSIGSNINALGGNVSLSGSELVFSNGIEILTNESQRETSYVTLNSNTDYTVPTVTTGTLNLNTDPNALSINIEGSESLELATGLNFGSIGTSTIGSVNSPAIVPNSNLSSERTNFVVDGDISIQSDRGVAGAIQSVNGGYINIVAPRVAGRIESGIDGNRGDVSIDVTDFRDTRIWANNITIDAADGDSSPYLFRLYAENDLTFIASGHFENTTNFGGGLGDELHVGGVFNLTADSARISTNSQAEGQDLVFGDVNIANDFELVGLASNGAAPGNVITSGNIFVGGTTTVNVSYAPSIELIGDFNGISVNQELEDAASVVSIVDRSGINLLESSLLGESANISIVASEITQSQGALFSSIANSNIYLAADSFDLQGDFFIDSGVINFQFDQNLDFSGSINSGAALDVKFVGSENANLVDISAAELVNANLDGHSTLGAGNDEITLGGNSAFFTHDLGEGNDTVILLEDGRNTIVGGAGEDVLDVSSVDAVSVVLQNEASGSIFSETDFSQMERVVASPSINGSLQLPDIANQVSVTADNTVSLGNLEFQNFATVLGGNLDDTFELVSGASIDSMQGLGGDDLFVMGTGASFGSIQGGGGVNTLQLNADLVQQDIVSPQLVVDDQSLNVEGIQQVTTTGDFQLTNTGNYDVEWDIFGENAVNISITGVTPVATSFESVSSIVSGSGNDEFILRNSGTLAGFVDGGAGENTLTAVGFPAEWYIDEDANGRVTGGIDPLNFSNITRFDGGGVLSAPDVSNTWTISEDGTVELDIDSSERTLEFAGGVTDLFGGSEADHFILQGNAEIFISGGNGADTLTGPDASNFWELNANNQTSELNSLTSFREIESVSGGNRADSFILSASAVFDTVAGLGGDDTFNLGAGSSVSVLDAGAGNDTITFAGELSIGSIDGGADTDTLDISALEATEILIGDSAYSDFLNTTISNIETYTGPSYGDVMPGSNGDNIWRITGEGTGSLTYMDGAEEVTLQFENKTQLAGGTGTDTFYFESADAWLDNAAGIDGGGGENTIEITVDEVVSWLINGEDAGSFSIAGGNDNFFSSISNLIGGAGADTFTLDNGGTITGYIDGRAGTNVISVVHGNNSSWNLGDTNSVTGINEFLAIETVEGGAGADTFNWIGASSVSLVDGGDGNDVIVLPNGAVAAELLYNTVQSDSGASGFYNFIERLDATGADSAEVSSRGNFVIADVALGEQNGETIELQGFDKFVGYSSEYRVEELGAYTIEDSNDDGTLILAADLGNNSTAVWDITGNYSGTLHAQTLNDVIEGVPAVDAGQALTFTAMRQLQGGAGNDLFINARGESINLPEVDGGAGNNTLAVLSGINSWDLNNAGVNLNGVTYNNIQSILGGDGEDAVTLADNTTAGNVITGAGDDTITVGSGATLAVLDGGAGNNSLTLDHTGDATWVLAASSSVTGGSEINAFSNFQSLTGSAGDDSFAWSTPSGVTQIEGAGGNDSLFGPFAAAAWLLDTQSTLTVDGENVAFTGIEAITGSSSAADDFTFVSLLPISIDGGLGPAIDTLTADMDGTLGWSISGDNAGRVANGGEGIEFTGVEQLASTGNAADTFTFANDSSINRITAGAGDDIVELASGVSAGTLDGGAGNDTLNRAGLTSVLNILGDTEAGSDATYSLVPGTFEAEDATGSTTSIVSIDGYDVNWTIEANGSVTVDYSGAADGSNTFDNVSALTGSDGDDSFLFMDSDGAVAQVDGGAGGVNTLEVGARTLTQWLVDGGQSGNLTINDGSATVFQNIAQLIGGAGDDVFDVAVADAGISTLEGGAGNNSLTLSHATASTWLLGESGSVEGINQFSGVQTLTGSDAADTFVMTGANAGDVTRIDGAAGNDLLDVTALEGAAVNLSDNTSGNLNFGGIETFSASAGNGSTLTGRDEQADWLVAGSGEVAYGDQTYAFNGFDNITGGTESDTYQLASTAINITDTGGEDSLSYTGTPAEGGLVWVIGEASSTLIDSADAAAITDASAWLDAAGSAINGIETLTGSAGDDAFILSPGANTPSLDGGAGENNLVATTGTNNWIISGSATGNLVSLNGAEHANFTHFAGGDGVDTFEALTGATLGNVSGNAGDDRLTLADGVEVIGDFSGGAGSDTLDLSALSAALVYNFDLGELENGISHDFEVFIPSEAGSAFYAGAGDVEWRINADGTFSITKNGTTTEIINTYGTLLGGDGDNAFVMTGGNFAGAIEGSETGDNTLTAADLINDWLITGANAGTLSNDGAVVTTFSAIQNLVGSNNGDTYTIAEGGQLASITAGTGADSLVIADPATTNTWQLGATSSVNSVSGFTGIEALTGNANTDSFTFVGVSDVTAINAGEGTDILDLVASGSADVNLIEGTAGDLTFTSVEDIRVDSTADATLTGLNDNGTWVVGEQGSVDYTGQSFAFSGFTAIVGGTGDDTYDLTDFNHSITDTGGTDSLTLSATPTDGALWMLNADNSGTLSDTAGVESISAAADAPAVESIAFSGMEAITGSAGNDAFIVADPAGMPSLNGGAGENNLIVATRSNNWRIESENSTLNDVPIENFTHFAGGDGVDTFVVGTGTILGNVSGNGGDDILALADGVTVIGIFTGGGGIDTLDLSALSAAQVYNFDTGALENGITHDFETFIASPAGSAFYAGSGDAQWSINADGTFTLTKEGVDYEILSLYDTLIGSDGDNSFVMTGVNFDGVIEGSEAGNNTLTATDLINEWLITGANLGTLSNDGAVVTTFSAIQNLIGGSEADTFTLNDGASVASINGGTGADSLTLADTTTTNAWQLGATSRVNPVATFTGIETLTGNANADTFTFTGASEVSVINAGEGADVLDLVASGSADVNLIEGTAGDLTFTSVEDIRVDNTAGATLTGLNDNGTWVLGEQGSVDYTGQSFAFSGFTTIVGGTGDDTYDLTDFNHSITDTDGTDSLTLSATPTEGALWMLNADNSGTLSDTAGVESITAAADAPAVEGVIFSGMEAITGSAGNDAFIVADPATMPVLDGGAGENNLVVATGTNTWIIDGTTTTLNDVAHSNFTHFAGGDGVDTLEVLAGTTLGNVSGNAGDDSLTLADGVEVIGDFSGGAGSDRLDLSALSAAQVYNFDLGGLENGISHDFEIFIPSAAGSAFYAGAGDVVWSIGANGAFTITKDGVTSRELTGYNILIGGDGDNQFVLTGANSEINSIRGSEGNNTLTAADLINEWLITGSNAGTLNSANAEGTSATELTFTAIANLVGGSNADTFTLQEGARMASIDGGAGDDALALTDFAAPQTNEWVLAAIGSLTSGGVDYVASFTNMEAISGNGGNDAIAYENGTSVTRIEAGLGDDSLSITGLDAEIDLIGGQLNESVSLSGLETYSADTAQANTLIGLNEDAEWTLVQTGSGEVTFASGAPAGADGTTVTFEQFGTLVAGTGSDSLITTTANATAWQLTGANSGTVNDDTGSTAFTGMEAIASGAGDDSFTLANAEAAIDAINAGEGSDTLTAFDRANTWAITASGEGSVENINTFTGVENLIGGDSGNSFTLADSVQMGDITGGAGDDTFTLGENSQTGTLSGNAGDDLFTLEAGASVTAVDGGDDNTGDVLDLWSYGAAFEVDFLGNQSSSVASVNVETVESDPELVTFFGGDGTNTWEIDAKGTGTLIKEDGEYAGSYTIADANIFRGGDGDDAFIFSGDGKVGTVQGGAGNNSLQGKDDASTWLISGANSGELTHSDGDSTLFSSIAALIGGSAADSFTLEAGGSVASLNGGAGLNDSLTNNTAADTDWVLAATDSLTYGTTTVSFGGIDAITGSTGVDTVAVEDTSTAVAGFDGRTGADTWDMTAITGNQTLDLANNTLSKGADVFSLSGFEYFTVAADNGSTVLGTDAAGLWQLSADGTGSVTYDAINTGFTGFEAIVAGAGDDSIALEPGAVTSIDAGAGSDTLSGSDADSQWQLTATGGSVTAAAASTTFTGVEALAGGAGADDFVLTEATVEASAIDGGAGTNSLTGSDADSTWDLTDDYSGTVSNVAFSSIQAIQGGSGADTFTLTDDITVGDISGGAGNDYFDIGFGVTADNFYGEAGDDQFHVGRDLALSGLIDGGTTGETEGDHLNLGIYLPDPLAETLQEEVGFNFVNFDDEDILPPNPMGIFDLSRRDSTNVWYITGEQEGRVEIVLNGNSRTYTFTDVHTLKGGGGSDTFIFDSSAAIGGMTFDGGEGDNSLTGQDLINQWLVSGINTGSLSAEGAAEANTFAGIASLIGGGSNDTFTFENMGAVASIDGAAGADSLIMNTSGDNLWQLTDSGFGVTGVDVFTGIEAITGNARADVFNISGDISVLTSIDGAAGSDMINWSNANAVNVNLTDSTLQAGTGAGATGFASVEGITSTANGNTIVGASGTNLWQLNGQQTGRVDYRNSESAAGQSLSFSGFTSLTGTAGEDTLDVSALEEDTTVTVAADRGLSADGMTLSSADALAGQATARTTLQGASDQAYLWVIDGMTSGTLASVAANDEVLLSFRNVQAVVGGANDDTFRVLHNAAQVALDGGAELTADFVDYSAVNGNLDINLADTLGGAAGEITGMEGLRGNNAGAGSINTATLTAADGNNQWRIGDFDGTGEADGINDGQVSDGTTTISFMDFNVLTGGAGVDSFEAEGIVTGTINGGAGNDTLTVTVAGNNSGTRFNGGADNDTLTLQGASPAHTVAYTPQTSGVGTFVYAANDESYTVSHDAVEIVSENSDAESMIVHGTTAIDVIALATDRLRFNGTGADIGYSNKANLLFEVGTGDTVQLSDNLLLDGTFGLTNGGLITDNPGATSIAAGELLLTNTGNVGSAAGRIRTQIDELTITNALGDIYLQEQTDLVITEASINGLIDLHLVDGSLTSTGPVTSADDFVVTVDNGGIRLEGANALRGEITLDAAAGDVVLHNDANAAINTNLHSLNAQNATVRSGQGLSGDGSWTVEGDTTLSAGGNIELEDGGNNFNRVTVEAANQVSLVDTDHIELAGLNSRGNVAVRSTGVDVTEAAEVGGLELDAGFGVATLDAPINATAGNVAVNANQITQNAAITSIREVNLLAATSVQQSAGISAGGDVDIQAQAGDVNVSEGVKTTGSDIVMTATGNLQLQEIEGRSVTLTSDDMVLSGGDITATQGDIAVETGTYNMNADTTLTANNGTVRINARDAANTNTISGGSVDILAGQANLNGDVTANVGTVVVNGIEGVNINRNVHANAGVEIRSANGDVNQNGNVTSNSGIVSVGAATDVNMSEKANTQVKSGGVSISAGRDVVIAGVVGTDDINVNAEGGTIKDGNGDAANVTGGRFNGNAQGGVGSEDALETRVGEVDVTTRDGNVELNNTGEVVVKNASTGTGDVKVTSDEDVTLESGSIKAGNKAEVTSTGGGVKQSGPLETPAISARTATVAAPNKTVGEGGIRIDAQEVVVRAKVKGGAILTNPTVTPQEYFDSSYKFEDQLLAVEPLDELNPAAFINVKSYFHNDISLRLPMDQLYEVDEQEEE